MATLTDADEAAEIERIRLLTSISRHLITETKSPCDLYAPIHQAEP